MAGNVQQEADLYLRQRAALRGSLKKWEAIVEGLKSARITHVIEKGAEDCQCCVEFLKDNCRECPIALYVDSNHCGNTPYPDWDRIIDSTQARDGFDLIDKADLKAHGLLVDARKLAIQERDLIRKVIKFHETKREDFLSKVHAEMIFLQNKLNGMKFMERDLSR